MHCMCCYACQKAICSLAYIKVKGFYLSEQHQTLPRDHVVAKFWLIVHIISIRLCLVDEFVNSEVFVSVYILLFILF